LVIIYLAYEKKRAENSPGNVARPFYHSLSFRATVIDTAPRIKRRRAAAFFSQNSGMTGQKNERIP